MRIAIGSDHAGFSQKEDIAVFLQAEGHEVINCGPATDDRCDYPDFAKKVADCVVDGLADFGVLVCGTGIGMSIAANKVHGIRAANATCVEFAQLAREHNNANIVTLSARFVENDVNHAIVKAFLATEFGGGRHAERVAKIMQLEN